MNVCGIYQHSNTLVTFVENLHNTVTSYQWLIWRKIKWLVTSIVVIISKKNLRGHACQWFQSLNYTLQVILSKQYDF